MSEPGNGILLPDPDLQKKYDALLAQARRLRGELTAAHPRLPSRGCTCSLCTALRDTADLEVTP
ncbi:MAG: hypothetical protein IMZ71_00375 [Chloroflexi bacterium]|nr:hypothetical protein [Chloroflexota bacterium]